MLDMSQELHQLEKKSEEEHCQIQKLTAMVKALEKRLGADFLGPTNLTQQTASSQGTTHIDSSTPSLPRPEPAVSASSEIGDDEDGDSVLPGLAVATRFTKMDSLDSILDEVVARGQRPL